MQKMRCRGEAWFVVRREVFDECALVTLRGAGEDNLGQTARVLEPFDRIEPSSAPTRIRPASRRRVLQHAAHAVARAHGWCEPWTAATANIDLLPWQLEPAMAAVCGATRLLLADEVGLGKTVQAGLVLTELRARGLISRALILTPASLREQWASELADRFALEPLVVDHSSLARLVSELPVGVNPWGIADLVISSIDLVKRPEVRAAVDAVPFDALVVDEAHHLRPGTDRGAVVADLASRVPWVALATATPHSGDDHAYAFLRDLGAARSDNLRVFRRTGCDVGRLRRRRPRFCAVTPAASERALLDQTFAYAHAVWRLHADGASHAAIVASVLCRRAASSAGAVLRTLERRRTLLDETPLPPALQPALPWLEHDAADDVEPDDILSSAGLPDRQRELDCLDRLIALARQAAVCSSKATLIERVLKRTRESLIVFSEYRDTIADLETRIGRLATVTLLHGGMSAAERRESVTRFVRGSARVLVATDAAGEGLNLQARCRAVINVELPWNPLRLEQRVGRVDRLGQTRRVHAFCLFHRDSFESDVLARLQRRMQNAQQNLADSLADERAVAAAVFDGQPLPEPLAQRGLDAADTNGCRLAAATSLRRRALSLATPEGVLRGHPLCATPARRRRLVDRLVMLFECDVHDARGRLIARELLPLSVRVQPGRGVPRGALRELCGSVAALPVVRNVLAAEMAVRGAATREATRRTSLLIERRLVSLLRVATSEKPALVQASLFDRRAEQQARANDAARAVLREHLIRRREEVQALASDAGVLEPRLIAAWSAAAE